jgi:outer membrane protein assembly factor BamB
VLHRTGSGRIRCHFWAVLQGMVVALTPAFGQEGWQWKDPSPIGVDILSAQFVNSSTVIAVAAYGNCLKSTDGGST